MTDRPTPPASMPPPTDPVPSTESPRRAHTILGRLSAAVREQNWFAVGLEVLIVIVGVVVGFQVTSWGQAQADARLGQAYVDRLLVDLRKDRDLRQGLLDYYQAVTASAEQAVALLADPAADPQSLAVHAYRATEYNYEPQLRATWDEIVSSGHIGLLSRAAGERVSDYFAYDSAANVLDVLEASAYRHRVRSVMPHAVQAAIRERCGDIRSETGSIVGFSSACDLGVDGAALADAARALRDDQAVTEGLRYQFSNLATARANIGGDVVYIDRAIAALEGHGPEREGTP